MSKKSVIFIIAAALFVLITWFAFLRDPGPKSIAEARQRLLDGKVDSALEYLDGRAKANDPEAMFVLGELYIDRDVIDGGGYLQISSITKDQERGAEFLRRAAALKFPDAMIRLAGAYGLGEGVPENKAEEERLLRQAAAAKNPMAYLSLAEKLSLDGMSCYLKTDSSVVGFEIRTTHICPESRWVAYYKEAIIWYERAAASSDETVRSLAIQALGKIYLGDSGAPKDYRRAQSWTSRSTLPTTTAGSDRSNGTMGDPTIGMDAQSREKYKNLTPDGQKYVRDQMKKYDGRCSGASDC